MGRSWRRVLHWFEIPCNLRRVFRASLEKIGKGGERAHVLQNKSRTRRKKTRNCLTPGVFNPGLQTFNPFRVVVEYIVIRLRKAFISFKIGIQNAR